MDPAGEYRSSTPTGTHIVPLHGWGGDGRVRLDVDHETSRVPTLSGPPGPRSTGGVSVRKGLR